MFLCPIPPLYEGRFPLGGILRGERNFSLFVSSDGKTMKNLVPRKILPGIVELSSTKACNLILDALPGCCDVKIFLQYL